MTECRPEKPSYEVAYLCDGETRSTVVQAADPVEAARRFQEDPENAGLPVLCVVRC